LQGRRGKIVAIKVSNYLKQEHIGQKTQGNPTAGAAGNIIDGNGWGRQFSFGEDRISRAADAARKITRLYTELGAVWPGVGSTRPLSRCLRFCPHRDNLPQSPIYANHRVNK